MGYFNDDEKETQPAVGDMPAAAGTLPVDGERQRIIREYLRKKYDEAAASDGVNGAQRKADMYDVASTVGKQVENYANASAPAMTYLQGWQRISEPKMTTPHKLENDWDGIRDAGREEVRRAEAARQDKLNAFKTGMELDDRSRAMVGAERQDALQAQEDDVASEVSRSYQALAKKMMPSRDFSTVSATQLKQVVPALEKAYQIDQKNKETPPAVPAVAASAAAKGSNSKLPSELNSSDKQRLDNVNMAVNALSGMENALIVENQRTFTLPLEGDNDFTMNRRLWEEAMGRMQSGGAITTEEEIRFKAMAPTWTDSAEMQKKKLREMRKEMNRRLHTLGQAEIENAPASSSASMAKIKAPDGSVRIVPRESVEKYLKKGGKLVE